MDTPQEVIRAVFANYASKVALEVEEEFWTYSEVLGASFYLRNSWLDEGLSPGDKVLLNLPNGPELVCCYITCLLFGFTAVPVDPALDANDFETISSMVHSNKVIGPEFRLEKNFKPIDDIVDWPTFKPDIPAAIFFTSGTTGKPKGVVHLGQSLVTNSITFNRQQNLDDSVRFLHFLPMTYMAGFLNSILSPLLAGGTIILMPRFTPQIALHFWKKAAQTNVNTMWVTPSICAMLLKFVRDHEAARDHASNIKNIFCGTAPLHNELKTKFREVFGLSLQESYGTSELLLISCQSLTGAQREENVGVFLDTITATVSDYDDNSELMIECNHAYTGYITDTGFSQPELSRNGKHKTGDAAVIESGKLRITGRLKDLIIRGGVNVSPIAIENKIGTIDDATDKAVIGVPDLFWGERIALFLEVGTAKFDADELAKIRVELNKNLPKAQKIDQLVCVETFPRTTSGKIIKRNLLSVV